MGSSILYVCNPGGQLKYYWQCWGASCVDGQLWVLMSAEPEAFHVELTSKETCRHGFHLSALAGQTIPGGGHGRGAVNIDICMRYIHDLSDILRHYA